MELKLGCRVRMNEDKMTVCGVQTHGIHKGLVHLSFRGAVLGGHVTSFEQTEHGDDEEEVEKWSDAILVPPENLEILGSDMGLQELLIAVQPMDLSLRLTLVSDAIYIGGVRFDLTKNLHSQSEEFYAFLLPLLQ